MPNDQSHDTRTTNPANRLAQAVGLSVAYQAVQQAPAGVIFQENFDAQPDWDSGLPENDLGGIPLGFPDTVQSVDLGHTMPTGWGLRWSWLLTGKQTQQCL